MRVCNCILGRNGKCCQEQGTAFGTGTYTSGIGTGFTYTNGKRAVRKLPAQRGWMVSNHPTGSRTFPTWRQAMDYANTRFTMWNNSLSGVLT